MEISISLIGLSFALFTLVMGDVDQSSAMYSFFVSPFGFGQGVPALRDSLPSISRSGPADEDDATENRLSHDRLNMNRMAINRLGYTCGVTGTGQIDPFQLGPKYAPPRPKTMKKKNRRGKKNKSSRNSTAAISETRSLDRLKREDAPNGGRVVPQNQLCWQVQIRVDLGNGTSKLCGGTIIGQRTILTAAHCLVNRKLQKPYHPSAMTVQVGDESRDIGQSHCVEIFPVDLILPHPGYDINLEDNDIGLIILNHNIDFDRKPCACKLCIKDKEPSIGDDCVVAGYGKSSEKFGAELVPLKWHKQRVLAQTFDSKCAFHIGSGRITDLEAFICAGDSLDDASCQGDEGSPFLCFDTASDSHYVAGVISFSAGCGKHIGSQYAKVRNYLNWIESNSRLDVMPQRGWNREIARSLKTTTVEAL